MFPASRRVFLGSSLAGLAASSTPILAADRPTPSDRKHPFQPDTLFLTWFHDPTTTMAVQWVGALNETADTTISYQAIDTRKLPASAAASGPAGAQAAEPWKTQATTTKPYPLTDLKVFRAELTGLTPGTDYQFRIGKESPTYRFRTMPAKATNAISFISGGDCGTNAHTIANNIQAARQDPLFALIGGDLAYENGRSSSTHLKFLRNYAQHMIGRDGRLIPLVACLGNHEVIGGYGTDRLRAPFFFALFDGLYRDTSYTALDFGNYLSLVLLDSGHTTPIGGEQASWLDQTLKARRDHPHVIVANHVPAYPSARSMVGSNGKGGTGAENRKHWVPLFEQYRVPVVLEHHDHTFKRTKTLLGGMEHTNGVLYLGDGSWGQLRALQPPEKLTVMAATSQDYHLTLHRIQGEERFHLAMDEQGRVMDLSHSGQRKNGSVRAGG
ncbi:MAG: metallophosphoesterase family protein [Bacteroidales bacterium]|nr:metallophosphoesterase family protein [Bacteroidales bacterium]